MYWFLSQTLFSLHCIVSYISTPWDWSLSNVWPIFKCPNKIDRTIYVNVSVYMCICVFAYLCTTDLASPAMAAQLLNAGPNKMDRGDAASMPYLFIWNRLHSAEDGLCFALLCFALLCFALLCFALLQHSPLWKLHPTEDGQCLYSVYLFVDYLFVCTTAFIYNSVLLHFHCTECCCQRCCC